MMEIKPRESLKYGDRYLYLVTESGKPVVGLQWGWEIIIIWEMYMGIIYTLQE